MTQGQQKALEIVQRIEARYLELYGEVCEIESRLEWLTGKKARERENERLEYLNSECLFLKQTCTEIEKAFGIEWEEEQSQSWEVKDSYMPVSYNTTMKKMVRVDGKIKYEYNMSLNGGFNLASPETGAFQPEN